MIQHMVFLCKSDQNLPIGSGEGVQTRLIFTVYTVVTLTPEGGGGEGGAQNISFGVDPIASTLPLVCTLSPEPVGGVFTKLAETHYWEGGKK